MLFFEIVEITEKRYKDYKDAEVGKISEFLVKLVFSISFASLGKH